jgi:hypothetical protein
VPSGRPLCSRTTARAALLAVTSVAAAASLAVVATACGAATKSGTGDHPRLIPVPNYTGTLPVSLQHTLTLPPTLRSTDIFQCGHLASVPYGARTRGRADCKYYGNAKGLVVAYYDWSEDSPVAVVSAAFTQSLEGGGWKVDRKGTGKFRIDGHGWHGVAFVFLTTSPKSSNAVRQTRAVIAVSPSGSKAP